MKPSSFLEANLNPMVLVILGVCRAIAERIEVRRYGIECLQRFGHIIAGKKAPAGFSRHPEERAVVSRRNVVFDRRADSGGVVLFILSVASSLVVDDVKADVGRVRLMDKVIREARALLFG